MRATWKSMDFQGASRSIPIWAETLPAKSTASEKINRDMGRGARMANTIFRIDGRTRMASPKRIMVAAGYSASRMLSSPQPMRKRNRTMSPRFAYTYGSGLNRHLRLNCRTIHTPARSQIGVYQRYASRCTYQGYLKPLISVKSHPPERTKTAITGSMKNNLNPENRTRAARSIRRRRIRL